VRGAEPGGRTRARSIRRRSTSRPTLRSGGSKPPATPPAEGGTATGSASAARAIQGSRRTSKPGKTRDRIPPLPVICPNCGRAASSDPAQRFCGACGEALPASADDATVPGPPVSNRDTEEACEHPSGGPVPAGRCHRRPVTG
jgi:hypothetical protein